MRIGITVTQTGLADCHSSFPLHLAKRKQTTMLLLCCWFLHWTSSLSNNNPILIFYRNHFWPAGRYLCPPPWRNPRKGRDQILPSGNPGVWMCDHLRSMSLKQSSEPSSRYIPADRATCRCHVEREREAKKFPIAIAPLLPIIPGPIFSPNHPKTDKGTKVEYPFLTRLRRQP